MLRLRKKRNSTPGKAPRSTDPQRLLDAQSIGGATLGGIAAVLVLSSFWVLFTLLTGRVFPWFSIVQALFVGLAVQRYGLGLDWRFPLVAALLAFLGAFLGNLAVAVPTTAEELGVRAYDVITGLTWWSLTTFFDEVITVVDYIYASFAAAVAAFYARRRLDRHQEYALRTRRGA